MNNHLTAGLSYFIDGFVLITKPGLRRFVVIPLLINTLLFIGLFFLSHHFIEQFNVWFAQHLPKWLQWLSTVLWLLFFISFFMTIVYTFVIVANIVSAPFNSFLAEKVEYYLTGHIAEGRSLYENLKDIPRIVGRQIAIIAYYIPRALLVMILFFVPIIQTLAPILAFLFHAWFMSLIYFDYPTDNHRVALKEVKVWMRQQHWLTLGFGMGVLISSMIPIINCLTIPAAVAGATKCWIEQK
jgi:CysZ protein